MEITGIITQDAAVHTLKDNRSVVNFNLAIRDGYKDKSGTWIDRTEFVSCAYWLNTGSANLLTKGTVVQLNGRMSAQAWHTANGETKAGLRFHTSAFKVVTRSSKQEKAESGDVHSNPSAPTNEEKDDLPF